PALLAGERVPVKVGGIAADSLGAQLGEIPWAISRHFVDEAVLVSDDDIRAAQKQLWTDLRLVVEPGGAAAYAALMTGAVKQQNGEKMVVVVCGSNCDPTSVM
ncbi:MAG TPA: pyridoxal-phosphate dependent enzyme, partial [Ilumatobacter sp.]